MLVRIALSFSIRAFSLRIILIYFLSTFIRYPLKRPVTIALIIAPSPPKAEVRGSNPLSLRSPLPATQSTVRQTTEIIKIVLEY